MITYSSYPGMANDYTGISDDRNRMPMDVPNGSTFYEMDTTVMFMFDKQNLTWYPQFALNGDDLPSPVSADGTDGI